MTIDERLESLAERLDQLRERHEALAQTVELMIGENDRRFAAIAASQQRNEERFSQLATAMMQLVEAIRRHDERLERLEGTS